MIDNAFYVRGASASLAGLPLQIDGGVYDFSRGLTGKAQLRLGVSGSGDLATLRNAVTFTRISRSPGAARLACWSNGPIDDPVIVAKVDGRPRPLSRHALRALKAAVVYHSNVVALAPVRVPTAASRCMSTERWESASISIRALRCTSKGRPSHLPYLDEMLGDEPILVDASATGTDLLFHVIGSAASARGVAASPRLSIRIPTGPRPSTRFGSTPSAGISTAPTCSTVPRHECVLDAGARPSDARGRAENVPRNLTPGDARRQRATDADRGRRGRLGKSHRARGPRRRAQRDHRGRRLLVARGGLRRNAAKRDDRRAQCDGRLGRFAGHGRFSSQQFAAYGAYRGTFEGLRPLIGDTLEGRGPIAGTVGIAIAPPRIVVQGSHLAMRGASLRGVPIDDASMTLAISGDRVARLLRRRANGGRRSRRSRHVRGRPGGREFADECARARRQRIACVASSTGIGLPLDGGTLSATGTSRPARRFRRLPGGVVVAQSRFDRFTMTGNGDVRLAGTAVALQRILGALGGTYANVNGRSSISTSRAPGYAIDAAVPRRADRARAALVRPPELHDGRHV